MVTPLISTCRITITLNIEINGESRSERKTCGFHLTRSKWDPYPWVGFVEDGSIADNAGLKTGDCLLQIDQLDIVGLKVHQIASLIKESGSKIDLQIWRSPENVEKKGKESAALSGPLPLLIRKFIKAVSNVVTILECPVCLDTATSPVSQCVHGHILCGQCRTKTLRCPVCRVRLGQGRCLVADEIQRNIKEAFDDGAIVGADNVESGKHSLKTKLFGRMAKAHNAAELENTAKKKYKMPFSRLLRGGFDRAMSAENLTTDFESFPKQQEKYENLDRPRPCKRLGELSLADRAKSASTGELCDMRVMSTGDARKLISSNGNHYLSVPVTSSWGGSMESVINNNNNFFTCPLFMENNCREPLTQDRVAEHIGFVHDYKNQMHIYGSNIKIRISSIEFEARPIWIFHYANHLFIFQYENDAASMVGANSSRMKWILHIRTHNKTELKFQRQVLQINEATNQLTQQSSSHQVKLPESGTIEFIYVEITPLQSDTLI